MNILISRVYFWQFNQFHSIFSKHNYIMHRYKYILLGINILCNGGNIFFRHKYIMQWSEYVLLDIHILCNGTNIFSGINILCNGTNIFVKTNIH